MQKGNPSRGRVHPDLENAEARVWGRRVSYSVPVPASRVGLRTSEGLAQAGGCGTALPMPGSGSKEAKVRATCLQRRAQVGAGMLPHQPFRTGWGPRWACPRPALPHLGSHLGR